MLDGIVVSVVSSYTLHDHADSNPGGSKVMGSDEIRKYLSL